MVTGVGGLVLFLLVVCVYQPVWLGGFIWDDADHLTQNPCVVGPLGLKEIWTTGQGQFYPLVLTLFWIEHALWGLSVLPYHLVDVLLHAGSAFLLWRVLLRLRVPGAWLGAALWAVHPVDVESVAWISETTNTLSALFYLLTILLFVRSLEPGEADRKSRLWHDAPMWLCAALALSAKSSTVILPLVLALAAWWREGGIFPRILARLVPVLVLALVAAIVTLWVQHAQEQAVPDVSLAGSWPERLCTAGCATWFYLGKLFWPHPLIAIYPRWSIDPSHLVAWLLLVAWMFLLVVPGWRRGPVARGLFFVAAYFTIALLPVLGFVEQSFFRFSFVADHFQYLASMGPLAALGAGLSVLGDFVVRKRRWLFSGLAALLLAALGAMAWNRVWAFGSQEALWRDTLAKNPRCAPAYDNLGWALAQQGRLDEAVTLYHQALEIDPRSFGALYNLGNAYLQNGQVAEAIDEYRAALAVRPGDAHLHSNLGVALLQAGELNQSASEQEEALRLAPGDPGALRNLAQVRALQGRKGPP